MTPQQYISELQKLIANGQDEAALAFSARHDRDLLPHLSDVELDIVDSLLEGAAMAVSMQSPDRSEAEASSPESHPERRTSHEEKARAS